MHSAMDLIQAIAAEIGTALSPITLEEINETGKPGFVLNDKSELVGLNLYGLKLSDIPKTVLQAKHLTHLCLYNNNLSDLIGLNQLTSLRYLDLSENRLESLVGMSHLKQLKKLYLWDNQIEDLTPLASLTELVELDIKRNQIQSLTGLEHLNLTYLKASKNPINEPEPLMGLYTLTHLELEEANIDNLNFLVPLKPKLCDLIFSTIERP